MKSIYWTKIWYTLQIYVKQIVKASSNFFWLNIVLVLKGVNLKEVTLLIFNF